MALHQIRRKNVHGLDDEFDSVYTKIGKIFSKLAFSFRQIRKLRRLKADKSNVLEKDNTLEYEPTQPYHPATKKYVDTYVKTYVDNVELVTTERLLISNNAISLPFKADGDIVNDYALIFNDLTGMDVSEFTCHISDDGWSVQFDPSDNLNGKYAVVSYTMIRGYSMYTTYRLPIVNNRVDLPYMVYGDLLFDYVLVYDDLHSSSAWEVTTNMGTDRKYIEFDPNDGVDGKYAIVSYMTII